MIKLGEYNHLKVLRTSDLGYMLTDGKAEILMHFKQATEELEIGKEVKVFIYADKEKRLTATMAEPFATLEQAGFVEVVEVLKGIGVFANINTPKDILISKDYLPFDEEQWPSVGDKMFVRLKLKGDILVGKPLNRFEIKELKAGKQYADYEYTEGYVCRIAEKGAGVITKDKMYTFIPQHQYRGKLHIGQCVNVCITKTLDGECYGTLNAHKEELIDVDMEMILKYLKEHNGKMNLTAKSSASEIEQVFHISRKAFKRAYGGLYKEHCIDFDENHTFLVKDI